MPEVHCYFCDQTYQAPEAARGKQVACRNCFRKLDVPLVDAPPPVSAPVEIELKLVDSDKQNLPKRPVASPGKPAAPVAKTAPAGKPQPASPAESDRWDFDAAAYESETIDSEELEEALPPVRKKKRSRPARERRWRRERTAPDGEFAPFDGLGGWSLLFNVVAAMILLPMGRSNPDAEIALFLIVMVLTTIFNFVDACLSGGFVRVLFLYIIPICIGLFLSHPDFQSVRFGYNVIVTPYALYVFFIRLRYVWPVVVLFLTSCIGCAIAISTRYPAAWGKMLDGIKKSAGW